MALTPAILSVYGLRAWRSARALVTEYGRRIMLHIGDIGNPALDATSVDVTSEALDMLASGDVLTHVYTPLTGGPLDEHKRVLPALHHARGRGVVLDGAMGDYGFGWASADRIKAAGILPDTVSSDFELYSEGQGEKSLMVENRRATGRRVRSVISLLEYLAFFLALDIPLSEVMAMSTSRAARAMGLEHRAGDLSVGKPADIAVLTRVHGRFALTDVTGTTRVGQLALVPHLTFKDGSMCVPGEGPHPWGFEPPLAA